MRPETHPLMGLWSHSMVETTMSLFKKILVPIDGSNTSNKALDYALKLAQADQAEVRLIYCIDELSLLSSHAYSGEMVQLARAGQCRQGQSRYTLDRSGWPTFGGICGR